MSETIKDKGLVSEKKMWIVIIAIELVYILFGRLIIEFTKPYSIDGELLRTLDRIVALVVILYFFRGFIANNRAVYTNTSSPLLIVSILLFFSIPLLTNYFGGVDETTKLLFALASLPAALHEEIAYRGVVQNLLLCRLSPFRAIFATSLIFTVYHIGALPWYISLYVQVFIAGLILGIIYHKTKSLTIVITIHAIYDALPSLTPIYGSAPLLSYSDGTIIMVAVLIGVVWWAKGLFVKK